MCTGKNITWPCYYLISFLSPSRYGPGESVIVAWLKEGSKPGRISLASKQWRAVDLQGNEIKAETVDLTERPVYFIAQGTNGLEPPW
jgi:hypothetical protein